jgi:hypothetical protein
MKVQREVGHLPLRAIPVLKIWIFMWRGLLLAFALLNCPLIAMILCRFLFKVVFSTSSLSPLFRKREHYSVSLCACLLPGPGTKPHLKGSPFMITSVLSPYLSLMIILSGLRRSLSAYPIRSPYLSLRTHLSLLSGSSWITHASFVEVLFISPKDTHPQKRNAATKPTTHRFIESLLPGLQGSHKDSGNEGYSFHTMFCSLLIHHVTVMSI